MIRFSLLHLCAWHLVRWCLYGNFQKSKNILISEPEWTTEIISTIYRRMTIPFQLVSMMLLGNCLMKVTTLPFTIIGSIAWWLLLYLNTPTIYKVKSSLDKVICFSSLVLHYLDTQVLNPENQSMMNNVFIHILSMSTIMLSGVILMDLSMDLLEFRTRAVANALVRISRYYTLIFQVRTNNIIYLIFFLQSLSAVYYFTFISTTIIVLSFGTIFSVFFIMILIWNIVVVGFCQYSKLEIPLPGTHRPIPIGFEYVLFYYSATVFHCTLFIALIVTEIVL
ncbi:unnamed protein product [Rotaria socialis]|uniref:Uncharacterized protein n=1 Tax=Rotaria socialis TaxID=392032 RepID=A0A818TKX1_9BILA|nr:unnamed protein product [Rotaria socialis]CAF3409832.1 unnamed protein product [Rotaria socialis]CAF3488302.1 unnamed protein product [Rotaria socialis]CAF3683410.1 unnamed protein product [Rotaria socialis]CAF3724723.1 unnamed protein product [Rotaria socialis]